MLPTSLVKFLLSNIQNQTLQIQQTYLMKTLINLFGFKLLLSFVLFGCIILPWKHVTEMYITIVGNYIELFDKNQKHLILTIHINSYDYLYSLLDFYY